jgi:hypothetical protein
MEGDLDFSLELQIGGRSALEQRGQIGRELSYQVRSDQRSNGWRRGQSCRGQ